MTIRPKKPGSRPHAYALVIFLVLMALASAFLAGNWATIRGLHHEATLLDRRQAAHWTNSPARTPTNSPAASSLPAR